MKRPKFAPVLMQPKAVYVAVCIAINRPYWGAFPIMQRVA